MALSDGIRKNRYEPQPTANLLNKRVLEMKQIFDLLKKHREGIVYIIFGVATTVVNWIVYTILVTLFHCGITAANAAAWIVAVLFAFWVNKLFVFQSKDLSPALLLKEGVSFFGTRVLSGVIEIFLPALLISLGLDAALLGIEGSLAKIVTAVFVIVLNYLLSKLIVFRNR